jgi:hypothetical protein
MQHHTIANTAPYAFLPHLFRPSARAAASTRSRRVSPFQDLPDALLFIDVTADTIPVGDAAQFGLDDLLQFLVKGRDYSNEMANRTV